MNAPKVPSDRFDLFSRTRDALSDDLVLQLAPILLAMADDLDEVGDGWGAARDRQSLHDAARRIRDDYRALGNTVGQAFVDRALRCLEIASTDAAADAANAHWQLLEEDELDVQILVGDLSNRIRDQAGAAYAAYAGRIAALTQRQWPNQDSLPLGARTLAHACCTILGLVTDSKIARSEVRFAMLKRLPQPLADIIVRANERLKVAGVEPLTDDQPEPVTPAAAPPAGSRATVNPMAVNPAPAAPAGAAAVAGKPADQSVATAAPAAAAQAATGSSAASSQQALQQSVASARVLDSSPLGAQAPAGQLRVLPTLQPVSEVERDAVAFAHSTDTLPYSRDARHAFFINVRNRMSDAKATSAQLAVVDVVAAMFDYVVDDRRLPESAKPLVWRLHQPAIVLSLLDPGYLGDEPRSLRRLIEHFGAIVTAFGDEMGKGGELHRRLETVVRAVEIVASALQTRSSVMARQVEHEYDRASRSVSQLIERVVNERQSLEATPGRRNRRDYRRRPDREREREVSDRLRADLSNRIAEHEVPESVREFVLNVWLRHLRTAALRDGEDSAEFKLAMQVVDHLLWSLDTGKARQSRRELAERIPPLIRLLGSGLREIGARDDEFKPFFDELFLVHLRKMQPRHGRDDSSTIAGTAAQAARTGEPPVPVLKDAVSLDTEIGPELDAALARDTDLPAKPRTRSAPPPISVPAPASSATSAAVSAAASAVAEKPSEPASAAMPVRPAAPTSAATSAVPVTQAGAAMPDAGNADAPPHKMAPITWPTLTPSGTSPRQPRPATPATGRQADAAGAGPEQKLLEVLNSLDLTDMPRERLTRQLPVEDAIEQVSRGDWLEFTSVQGVHSFAKVAWINHRRTVVLLVRHPDRKAMSLRMAEMRTRFEQGRARLIEPASL